MKLSGRSVGVCAVVALLSACAVAPRDVSRAPTMGDCLWARGQSMPSEGLGGVQIDSNAIQSCDAEIRAWEQRQAAKQATAKP